MPAIGIDLGTTFSCVGVWEHEAVTIIPNKLGNRTTPSWVSYYNGERLVGEAARSVAGRNPKNTIFDSKRLIGCKFSDPLVQDDLRHFPFPVVCGDNDNPYIQVTFEGQAQTLSAEQVGAAILSHMKGIAEDYLGMEVTQAVVTVPSYFNDAQRQSTKDAGVIAGLDIVRLINEPTAAAIAYGLRREEEDVRNIIVFDLGGGTLDVTLVTAEAGVFEVMATCGDTHLGGEDFDNALCSHCIQVFREQHGVDLSSNARAMKRLKEKCQEAKHALSSNLKVDIFIESLVEDTDLDVLITREAFESMNAALFERCTNPVKESLQFAGMEAKDVHEILLIGGSTRMPYIQTMLEAMFEGKKCNKHINPDEAVAFGASIVAANATLPFEERAADSRLGNLTLMDVTPLNLGLELFDGKMSVLIPANTTIPYSHSKVYHNDEDNQTEVEILIYEGQHRMARDNKLLGCFHVSGLPPRPRGALDIEITFTIDVNGIMAASAKVSGVEGVGGEIQIQSDKGLLSNASISEKSAQESKFAQQMLAKKKLDQLEELLTQCRRMADEGAGDAEPLVKAHEWMQATREAVAPAQYAEQLDIMEDHLASVQQWKAAHKKKKTGAAS